VGVCSFAVGTQIKVDAVDAVPSHAADRLFVAAITGDAAVDNTLVPCTFLRNVVQCALECLAVGISDIAI
jgi:hypothetical protein